MERIEPNFFGLDCRSIYRDIMAGFGAMGLQRVNGPWKIGRPGHLADQTNTIDGCRADHGMLGGIQAVTQHGQTRRLRQDPPTENDVRNAIERATVSATRIEILLNESVVAEGLDRVLTLPWTRTSSRRRGEIIPARGRSAATPTSNANEGARRLHQSIARRSTLARRTPIRPHPDHRVARCPRGQERTLDPDDAVPRVHVPRPGGSRDGGSPSAKPCGDACGVPRDLPAL